MGVTRKRVHGHHLAGFDARGHLIDPALEAEQAIAARFAIRSIPTLLLFAGGREVARSAGALDLQAVVKWVRHKATSI